MNNNSATVEKNRGTSSVVNNIDTSSYISSGLVACETREGCILLLDIWINDQKISALIDTGASRNFVSHKTIQQLGLETWRTKAKLLHFADGSTTLDEKTFLTIDLPGWTFCNEFFVGALRFNAILGLPWLQYFGIELIFNQAMAMIKARNGWMMKMQLDLQPVQNTLCPYTYA